MPGKDGLKLRGVERARFDKLKQAGFVLGATGLERNRGQMFGGEHARGRADDILFDSLRQRLAGQWIGSGKELHRPAGDDDVFPLHFTTARLEVVKDRLRTGDQFPAVRPEGDEDVHVKGGNGFKIEGRAHRAADGVAFDERHDLRAGKDVVRLMGHCANGSQLWLRMPVPMCRPFMVGGAFDL